MPDLLGSRFALGIRMNMFSGLKGAALAAKELREEQEDNEFIANWRALPPEEQSLCPFCRVNTFLFGCFCFPRTDVKAL